MSTSIVVLRKRLADIGRHDLLAAAEAGEISTYAAAEEAGLVRRRPVTGNGSENQAKKRAWALARITRQAQPPQIQPEREPEHQLGPVSLLPPEVRAIVEKLVAADRADLIIAVAEQRMSPFQAAAIVDRGGPPRTPKRARKATAGFPTVEKRNGKQKAVPAEPEKPKIDVRCLIA
jgi:hypothetical protein